MYNQDGLKAGLEIKRFYAACFHCSKSARFTSRGLQFPFSADQPDIDIQHSNNISRNHPTVHHSLIITSRFPRQHSSVICLPRLDSKMFPVSQLSQKHQTYRYACYNPQQVTIFHLRLCDMCCASQLFWNNYIFLYIFSLLK